MIYTYVHCVCVYTYVHVCVHACQDGRNKLWRRHATEEIKNRGITKVFVSVRKHINLLPEGSIFFVVLGLIRWWGGIFIGWWY